MKFGTAAWVVAVAALGQDTEKPLEVRLAWKFVEGAKWRIVWKSRLEQASTVGGEALPKTDSILEIHATLRVVQAPADGPAACEMKVDEYALKGIYHGREIDARYEGGEMKSVKGLPDGGAQMKEALAGPLPLTLSAQGEFKAEDQGQLSRVFAGESVWFGPRLPERAVAIGDVWEERLQSPQAKTRGGPAFDVKRKFESLDAEGTARIVTDEEKVIDQMGIKVTMRIVSQDWFDVERGFCARSKLSIRADGGGELEGRAIVVSARSVVELEVAPLAD